MYLKEIRFILILLLAGLLSSCQYTLQNNYFKSKLDNVGHVYQFQYENYKSYEDFRSKLTDSLELYSKLLTKNFAVLNFGSWEIDSVIIFNKDSTRFITNINRTKKVRMMTSDDLYELYGFRLNKKWYLLAGSSTQAPRYYYTNKFDEPLDFEQLGFLAKKEVLSGFILSTEDGYEINYRAFDSEVFYPVRYRGPDDPPKPRIISYNHDSILMEQFKKQRFTSSWRTMEDIKNYVHDYYPPEKDLRRDELKLFDSKAWANRHEILYKHKHLLNKDSNTYH